MPRLWPAGVATDAGRQKLQPPSDGTVVVLKLLLRETDSLSACDALLDVLFSSRHASHLCRAVPRTTVLPLRSHTGSNTCAAAAAADLHLFCHLICYLASLDRFLNVNETVFFLRAANGRPAHVVVSQYLLV